MKSDVLVILMIFVISDCRETVTFFDVLVILMIFVISDCRETVTFYEV